MKIHLRCIRFYFLVGGKNYDVMHEGESTGGNARDSRNVFKIFFNGEKVNTYHMTGGHANKTNAKKVLEKYLNKPKND